MVMPSEIAAAGLALPLRCKQSQDKALEGRWLIVDAQGRKLCLLGADADAGRRAQQIVEAVNAYPDLLAAVRAGTQFAREVAANVEVPHG